MSRRLKSGAELGCPYKRMAAVLLLLRLWVLVRRKGTSSASTEWWLLLVLRVWRNGTGGGSSGDRRDAGEVCVTSMRSGGGHLRDVGVPKVSTTTVLMLRGHRAAAAVVARVVRIVGVKVLGMRCVTLRGRRTPGAAVAVVACVVATMVPPTAIPSASVASRATAIIIASASSAGILRYVAHPTIVAAAATSTRKTASDSTGHGACQVGAASLTRPCIRVSGRDTAASHLVRSAHTLLRSWVRAVGRGGLALRVMMERRCGGGKPGARGVCGAGTKGGGVRIHRSRNGFFFHRCCLFLLDHLQVYLHFFFLLL